MGHPVQRKLPERENVSGPSGSGHNRKTTFVVLTHLKRILVAYIDYYHRSHTHLSLKMDSPLPRPIQTPDEGKIIAVPQVDGLHHRYKRRAP
jgi:hypothetical protein